MRLARTFVEIDSAEKDPASAVIKSYSPVGRVSGTGNVDVSASEVVLPAQEIAFHSIRFEINSGEQYSRTGVATVPFGDAEKLLATIDKLAKATIATDRFAFTEIEVKIEGLRIVLFNDARDRVAFLVEADGVGCHFARQAMLLEMRKLVVLATEHLTTRAAAFS